MRLLSTLAFLGLYCSATLQAQPTATLPAFLRDSLDTYVTRALKDWNIPGVAVGVVKDGKLVVAKGYGVLEAGKPEKVDVNTLFAIGSNTKAFTGTALAMLENDGLCKLDDPVAKHLSGFNMKDDWGGAAPELAGHREPPHWHGDLPRRFHVLDEQPDAGSSHRKIRKLTPIYPFRTTWGYCNAGFLIAGKCIERISGKTWEDNLRQRICT